MPDPTWASSPTASPPSYATGRLPVVGFSDPGGATTVPVGGSTTVDLGVQPAGAGSTTVLWSASGTGVDVAPSRGRFVVGSPGGRGADATAASAPTTQALSLSASTPGPGVVEVRMRTSGGKALPSVVIDVDVTG